MPDPPADPVRAVPLLERLVADPRFRAEFRRDPEGACERFGLPDLGAEIAARGKALHTLDARESRSSLAGALAAMAAEAIGVIDLVAHAHNDPESETGRAMSIVLTRIDLKAVAPGDEPPPGTDPPGPAGGGRDDPAGVLGGRADAGAGGGGRDAADGGRERGGRERAGGRDDPAGVLGGRPVRDEPDPVRLAGRQDADAPPAEPAPDEPPAGAPAGGTDRLSALLADPQFEPSALARGDLERGAVDPRLVAILHDLVGDHEIGVSVFESGHGQFVAGSGSVSNHFFGRAVDISTVDGLAVSPGNAAAQQVAEAVGRLDPALRPSEIGSPWDLGPAPFFTDPAHQDHLHLGFDDPPTAEAERLLDEPVAPAVPDAPDAPEAEEAPPVRRSAVFAAVREQEPRLNTLGRLAAVAADSPAPPGAAEAAEQLAGATPGGGAYPGDNASREELAAWMAGRARAAGLPGELPVMAALVESGLENKNYGDRDSVGFFQMRTSIWDRGAYAGYADDPELQLQWFIDQAKAVKALRIEQGDADYGRNAAEYGRWVADVEKPATEFRDRYAGQLDAAQDLVAGVPAAAPGDGAAGNGGGARALSSLASDADAAGAHARDAVALALDYRGMAYQWGGESPDTGFDCSGLAQWVYGREGIELPRVAADQYEVGRHVERDDLVPGDLVFFADDSGYIHHMGISLGGDRFVHAPHTGDVVKVSSLDEDYYAEQFAGGRRVDASAPVQPEPPVRPVAAAGESAVRRSAVFAAARGREARMNTLGRLAAVAERGGGAPARPPGGSAGLEPPDKPSGLGGSAPVAGERLLDSGGAGGDFPGNDASREETAAWMADRAEAAGLPRELPVMAALVESGLQNLDHGDRDSVGFFQMRTSIWDRGAYKGYADDPELQLQWFIDQAKAVKALRIDQGDADFGSNPAEYGRWVADIERPAFEFRDRYGEQLAAAQQLVAGTRAAA